MPKVVIKTVSLPLVEVEKPDNTFETFLIIDETLIHADFFTMEDLVEQLNHLNVRPHAIIENMSAVMIFKGLLAAKLSERIQEQREEEGIEDTL